MKLEGLILIWVCVFLLCVMPTKIVTGLYNGIALFNKELLNLHNNNPFHLALFPAGESCNEEGCVSAVSHDAKQRQKTSASPRDIGSAHQRDRDFSFPATQETLCWTFALHGLPAGHLQHSRHKIQRRWNQSSHMWLKHPNNITLLLP